ncbi:MAG: hypothetical protein R3F14_36560 [Polyangiaceae bacterium]
MSKTKPPTTPAAPMVERTMPPPIMPGLRRRAGAPGSGVELEAASSQLAETPVHPGLGGGALAEGAASALAEGAASALAEGAASGAPVGSADGSLDAAAVAGMLGSAGEALPTAVVPSGAGSAAG